MALTVGILGRVAARRRVAQAGAMRRAGDPAGAVEALAELLADEPEDPAANVEMARALHVLGDSAGAEEHYRRALVARLEYRLIVELAGAVAEQGRGEEAEELVAAALEMTEHNRRLDTGEALLVRAVVAAGEGRVDDARSALDAIDSGRSSATTREYARRLRERLP